MAAPTKYPRRFGTGPSVSCVISVDSPDDAMTVTGPAGGLVRSSNYTDTLRHLVRQGLVDDGERPGFSSPHPPPCCFRAGRHGLPVDENLIPRPYRAAFKRRPHPNLPCACF